MLFYKSIQFPKTVSIRYNMRILKRTTDIYLSSSPIKKAKNGGNVDYHDEHDKASSKVQIL
jgi:hypothetical protein